MIRSKEGLASGTSTMPCHGRNVNVSCRPRSVLAAGDRLKVIVAYTSRIAAKMIEFQSFGYRAISQLIGDLRSWTRSFGASSGRTNIESSSSMISGSSPRPTGFRLVDLLPEALFERLMGQLGGTSIFPPHHVMVTAHAASTWRIGIIAAVNHAFHSLIIPGVVWKGNPC